MSVARSCVVLVASLLVVSGAGAATITFEGVSAGGFNSDVTSVSDGGFTFSSGHFHIVDVPEFCAFGGCTDNGGISIGEEDGSTGFDITMTRNGGGGFDFGGFDAAQAFVDDAAAAAAGFPNASFVLVSGSFEAGGGIFASFALDDTAFESFALGPDWTDLTSVTFSGRQGSGLPGIPGFAGGGIALDNFIVDTNAVPEPSSAILFGAALLVVGAALRRRAA